MNVLIACEESQEVCRAFRIIGHKAYSCDIVECSGGHPEWHIKGDCLNVIKGCCNFITQDGHLEYVDKWDLIIAHPPCTYLTVSGNRWFNVERYGDKARERLENRKDAIRFFYKMIYAPCYKIAVENPIGIMSTVYRKPDQIIQPWQFGHGESKATCLWLKNLPPLQPTNIVEERQGKCWRMPPSKDRQKLRSKTYRGIAEAMAQQWGFLPYEKH